MKTKLINDDCGNPFLVRISIFEVLGYALKLHIFLRSDRDRELHDHPWSFWTLVLGGGYREIYEDRDGVVRELQRKPWSLAFRRAEWKHRVELHTEEIDLGVSGRHSFFIPSLTLVLVCPKRRMWGFWRGKVFIPWRNFKSDQRC